MEYSDLKVLLIHPEISRTRYNFVGVIENECIELEYISAMLKEKGISAQIYDGQVERESALKKIKNFSPHVVYVCGRTRQENFMLEYCREAKENDAGVRTVIGGLHAQLCYERMAKEYVDYILTSFDVYQLLNIIRAEFFGGERNFDETSGVCYREGAKWVFHPSVAVDIAKMPRPDRSYFYEHPKNYRYLELEHAAWVRTSFSCPYRCRFCHRNRMNGGVYSARDIADVVEEIAEIKAENIYLCDDDFLFDEDRLWEFVRLVKEKNIQKNYICYGRADFIARQETLMKALKEIGLYYVLVGLETIRDDVLKDYEKRSDVNANVKSIQICNSLGIHLMGMFIVGLEDKPKDFRLLYKFVKENHLRHVAISIYTPELGLENFAEYESRLITDNPSHWDYLHLVAKPKYMGVRRYYFHYYLLLIRLFLKAKREGVYDFIDYGDYIRSFIKNMFQNKRENDDE